MTALKPASAVILSATLLLAGCDAELLRGEVTPSEDGHTYFAVLEYGGGDCDTVTLDGMTWPHSKGQFAKIDPGTHTIADCNGSEIGFDVPAGARFGFDYWGP
jgi:hypothetical protein